MEKGLLEKTGKDLKHWIEVVKNSGLEKHGEIVKFLKEQHAFTHGFANFVALSKNQSAAIHQDDALLLEAQYKGKEALKPLFHDLDDFIKSLGNDIKITPKKDSVSYIRKNQFALIKPATKSRIDLGLKIKGQEPSGILENSGPFGSMCTHRIQIQADSTITDEIRNWIRQAYEASL